MKCPRTERKPEVALSSWVRLQMEGSDQREQRGRGVHARARALWCRMTGVWSDENKNMLLVLCNVSPGDASPVKVLCLPDASGASAARRARCVVCRPRAAGARTA